MATMVSSATVGQIRQSLHSLAQPLAVLTGLVDLLLLELADPGADETVWTQRFELHRLDGQTIPLAEYTYSALSLPPGLPPQPATSMIMPQSIQRVQFAFIIWSSNVKKRAQCSVCTRASSRCQTAGTKGHSLRSPVQSRGEDWPTLYHTFRNNGPVGAATIPRESL